MSHLITFNCTKLLPQFYCFIGFHSSLMFCAFCKCAKGEFSIKMHYYYVAHFMSIDSMFVPKLEPIGSSSQIKDNKYLFFKMAKYPCLNSPEDLLRLYQGKDYIEVFCNHIEEEAKRLYHLFLPKPMKLLMMEQWREFNGAAKGHICGMLQTMREKGEGSLPLHWEYRGAAHLESNLWYAIPHYIPVVFHNLSGYDMHLFIRELGKKLNSGSICVIAKNLEKSINVNINVAVAEYETTWVG